MTDSEKACVAIIVCVPLIGLGFVGGWCGAVGLGVAFLLVISYVLPALSGREYNGGGPDGAG